MIESPDALASGALLGAFTLHDGVLEVCTAQPAGKRPASVGPRLMPAHEDQTTIRAGLAGYSRLKRLARSFEEEDLQGPWELLKMDIAGVNWQFDAQQRHDMTFADHNYVLHHVEGGQVRELRGTFRLDPAQPTRFMDLTTGAAAATLCLYEIQGDRLSICMAGAGASRPQSLQPDPALPQIVILLERKASSN